MLPPASCSSVLEAEQRGAWGGGALGGGLQLLLPPPLPPLLQEVHPNAPPTHLQQLLVRPPHEVVGSNGDHKARTPCF